MGGLYSLGVLAGIAAALDVSRRDRQGVSPNIYGSDE